MTTSHWKRIVNEDTHLILIPKNKNVQKYQNFYLAAQMEHDQSSYFCRGPDDFCWGPAPEGPTLVAGWLKSDIKCWKITRSYFQPYPNRKQRKINDYYTD